MFRNSDKLLHLVLKELCKFAEKNVYKHYPDVLKSLKWLSENTKDMKFEYTELYSLYTWYKIDRPKRKKDKNDINNNPYIQKFLSSTSWRPNYLDVFAGQIVYSKYKLVDKIMILFIMWLTKGPTDTSMTHEFTDWSKIKNFSNTLINKI